MLVLPFVALRFVLCLALRYFVFVLFFNSFSIEINLLGEEKANLSVFSYVCSIWAYLFLSVFFFFLLVSGYSCSL